MERSKINVKDKANIPGIDVKGQIKVIGLAPSKRLMMAGGRDGNHHY